MRYTRVLLALVVAALAIGAALLVRSAASPPHVIRSAAAVAPSPLRRTLQREVQQFLVPRFRSVLPAPKLAVPEGGTCFVGPGRCSETPCVVPVQSDVATPVVASGEAPATRLFAPRGGRCPGGEVAPRTLRVVGH